MKVEIGENNCLLVLLEKEEAEALRLNAAAITCQDPTVRRTLASVYKEAALQVGFVPQSYTLRTIEMLPFENGSILFCFSFHRKNKLKICARRAGEKKVYQFFSQADFAAFIEHASHLTQLPEGVYKQGDAYRFIIAPHAHDLEKVLGEYAAKITLPFALQYTTEYWEKVYTAD